MKRSVPIKRKTRIRARRATPRDRGELECTAYLEWLRTRPCCVAGFSRCGHESTSIDGAVENAKHFFLALSDGVRFHRCHHTMTPTHSTAFQGSVAESSRNRSSCGNAGGFESTRDGLFSEVAP